MNFLSVLKQRVFFPAAICTVLIFQSLATAQVLYSVKELAPSTGYVQSEALAINERGDVVGTSYPTTINWNGVATRWVAGKPIALGINKGGLFSTAFAINRTGVVVGDGDDRRPNAVIFNKSGGTFLTKGANNSFAIFVSDSGLIFGNLLKGFDGNFMPVVWSADPKKAGQYLDSELVYIDEAGVQGEAYMLAANNAGQAVGFASDSVLGQVPVIWDSISSNARVLTGPLGIGVTPLGINDLGVVVGIGGGEGMDYSPAIWSGAPDDSPIQLPLFEGEVYGYSTGINNHGVVIGNHTDLPAVWSNGLIYDVNTSLDVTGKGWIIEKLNDINDSGIIVGTGFKNGVRRGVILTPVVK